MSNILIPIRPGQIWFKNYTKNSWMEITNVYPSNNMSMRVGYKPILEHDDAQIEVLDENDIYNAFTFVFDLYDFLSELVDRNPQIANRPPDKLEIHQLWCKHDDRKAFMRVTQIGHADSDSMSYVPILPGGMPRRIVFSKQQLSRHFIYLTNLIDILKHARSQAIEMKSRNL